MFKKFNVLMLILICGLFTSSCCAFSDTSGHWADNDINVLALNDIVSGYQDGTFRPNNNMTRAELVTIVNRILGNTIQDNRYVPDINAKDWFYTEIRRGISSGIIEGDTGGYVYPNNPVTRQEAIVILSRAFLHVGDEISAVDIKDMDDVSNWAKKSMHYSLYKGYIKGYSDQTIKPKNNITRAEVVKLIRNMVNVYANLGSYTGLMNGNVIIRGKNITLSNATINGNLIIAEGAENLSMQNIIIEGDLILRRDVEIPEQNFKLKGNTYDISPKIEVDASIYVNEPFGISFNIPSEAVVIYDSGDKQDIDFKQKNLMVIRIRQDNDLYFKDFDQMAHIERTHYDIAYDDIVSGKIGIYRYIVYGNERENSYLIYLKRDNIEYVIYLFNIDNINVIDSLTNSIKLFNGSKVDPHELKTYRNPSLYLKFNYLDYVMVDDSYNTGDVNDQESFFKLFIQVTNIIDISNYTIDQLKDILVDMEDTSSTIIDTKVQKVYTYDAIEYTVSNDGKLSKSLYVVISNKLYHFIFTGEEDKMNSVGIQIYQDIVNSIEF